MILTTATAAPAATSARAGAAPRGNEPPIARPQEIYTEVDRPVSIWLDYQDPDGPTPFVVEIEPDPAHGELVWDEEDDPEHPRHYELTPDPGYSGFDSFSWAVTDGHGSRSDTVTAQILVNAKPVAEDQQVLLLQDTPVEVELLWSDDGYPGVPPAFEIKVEPEHGTAVPTGPGVYLYTPAPGFFGEDDFQWIVSDGAASSNWGRVTLAVNRIPHLPDGEYLTPRDTPFELWPPVEDDGFPGPASTEIVVDPQHGTLEETAPNVFLYTPNPGESAVDTFTWKVNDGMVDSNEAEATVYVNALPIAHDQEEATLVDTMLQVTLDAEDDGIPRETLEYEIRWGPNHGTVEELQPGVYLYRPPQGYVGPDSFTWNAHDGAGWSEKGRVGIDVHLPQELSARPVMVNLVESMETEIATTSFELSNAGGGVIEWSATPSDPDVRLEPAAGQVDPDNPERVAVEIPIADRPPGVFTSRITVTSDAGGSIVLPINLTIVELEGKNIGIEDMTEVAVLIDGTGDEGGEAGFVNGPGEAPTLEVSLDSGVPVGMLDLIPPTDLSGVGYLQFDLDAPPGTWVVSVLEESLADGENWTVDPFAVYTPGAKRYHVPIEDFQYRDSGEARPIDLSQVERIMLRISVPMPGEYGYPGDDAERKVRLRDLRFTESSVDITAALATESVTVTLDAGLSDGTMARPWEGITRFQDEDELLTDLGFRTTRESVLDVNDWEVNDRLVPDVGDYHFEMIDTTYRRFAPEIEHVPWIPTIPFLLWQEQDPDILIDGLSQVDRPKYAFMPPSDVEVWQQVVADLVRYHQDSGVNVKAYSILNEPDGRNFWQGTDLETLDLFAQTAEAIKGVDPALAVVGPSYTDVPDPERLRDFLDYCAAFDVPLDYLSFHTYLESRPGADTFRDAAAMIRDILGRYGDRFADTRLMVNEWGHSLPPQFEERNRRPIVAAAAASAFKGMVDADYDSALWFKLAAARGDVYYASGLLDFDGFSARPVLHAFDLFNRLGPERVAAVVDRPATGIDTLASIDPETGVARVLVWWSLGGDGFESGSTQVRLDFSLPEGGEYTWERLVIDDWHGNFEEGQGYEPLEPVGAGVVSTTDAPLSFDLPLYGVSMVTFTPLK